MSKTEYEMPLLGDWTVPTPCIVYVTNAQGQTGAVHFTPDHVGVDPTVFRGEEARTAIDAALLKLADVQTQYEVRRRKRMGEKD